MQKIIAKNIPRGAIVLIIFLTLLGAQLVVPFLASANGGWLESLTIFKDQTENIVENPGDKNDLLGNTLVGKESSGIFIEEEGEQELVSERTQNFKKFDKGNGEYRVAGGMGPIHYRDDPFNDSEQYKEIDLSILPESTGGWDFSMTSNGYQAYFDTKKEIDDDTIKYLARYERAGKWLEMAPAELVWENEAGGRQIISLPKESGEPEINNDQYFIKWKNVFGEGIDFQYNIAPDKFFKTVIINSKENLPEATIDKTGLVLKVVMSVSWDEKADPANDFAENVQIDDLTSNEESTTKIQETPEAVTPEATLEPNNIEVKTKPADEELNDPKEFSFQDEANRNIWWFEKPKAWDSADKINDFDLNWKLYRQDKSIFMNIDVPAETINSEKLKYPFYIDTSIPEELVGASGDDGQHEVFTYDVPEHSLATNSTTTRVGYYDSGDDITVYDIFSRFSTVPIPQGATINSASISFRASSTLSNNLVATDIYANAADNATAPTDDTTWHAKTLTTAYTAWDNVASWTSGAWYSSPDIASVVSEVTSRGGWTSDNALLLFWNNTGWSNSGWRYFYNYDYSGNVSGPKFNATYTAAGITISGTVYTAEDKLTNIGAGHNIGISVNGGAKSTVSSGAGGAFSFSSVSVSANQPIAILIDDDGSYEGTLVTQAVDGSSNITGLEMYTNKVVLTHQTAGPMTNALLITARATGDTDIHYTNPSGSVITFDAGYEAWVDASKTYTPGGGVIAGDIDNNGTLTPEANTITSSGNVDMTGGTWTTGNGTLAMSGTSKSLTSDAEIIYNFTPFGTILINDDLTVSHILNISAGTFNASSRTITLSGSSTPFVVGGAFTPSSSTVKYTGTLATDVTGTTYNNLTLDHTGTTFTAEGDIIVTNVFDINAGTFDASNKTIDLSGAGVALDINDTLTANASTFIFSSSSAQTLTCNGNNFFNLTSSNSSASGLTFFDSCTATGTFSDTTSGSNITFNDGSTYAFGDINLNGGDASTRITMISANPGTQYLFNVTDPTPTANYINISDSDASGGSQIDATTGGFNSGNNLNWLFGVASITVAPTSATLDQSATQAFTATAYDSSGFGIPGTVFAWSVVAGGGSIDGGGNFTAGTTAGIFTNTVRATASAVNGLASVTVNEAPIPDVPAETPVSTTSSDTDSSDATSSATPSPTIPERAEVEGSAVFDASNLEGFVSFHWDFGDGNQADGAKVEHKFAEINRYTVILVLKDKYGNESRKTNSIDVLPPVPELTKIDSKNTIAMLQGKSFRGTEVIITLHSDPYETKSDTNEDGIFNKNFGFDETKLAYGAHTITVYAQKKISDELTLKSDSKDYNAYFNLNDGELDARIEELEARNRKIIIAAISLGALVAVLLTIIIVRRKRNT
ncbi:hypothetical protein A2215_02120 [Candidatus Berkelbacteria bacterium RIFOXYA2_FULL_43_10]|uniref:PKD domain-containing protein n=1 Tax=Candidatus Berkelbacteria bacterium RIFOXYA2_FULL_43_10 TaxID=1797472 RepID=A0A1F5E3M8_9BACT|nr:MAG: hypothetical protein A2215_02120 [Candidatus Berkelbacteria bacterium RIFOXYA2_FULL_43_10]